FFIDGPTRVGTMPLDTPGDWTALGAQGTPPIPRYGFSLAYDPVRDRILLAGGYNDDPRGHSRYSYRDVWALSLAEPPTWQQLRADVSPGPVLYPDCLAYDAAHDRFVSVAWDFPAVYAAWTLPADGSADWTVLRTSPSNLTYPMIAI